MFKVIETEPGVWTVCDEEDGEPVTDHGEPEYSGEDEVTAHRMVRELERFYACQDTWDADHDELA